MLKSGFVPSLNPGDRTVPDTFDQEIANVFIHVEALLDAAGGTLDDVLEIEFLLAPGLERAATNDAYVAKFPDEGSRPACSVTTGHTDFPLTTTVGARFAAYIDD
jgi:enamine deaminase RidA (YjgF/YER057c/UK114 family)